MKQIAYFYLSLFVLVFASCNDETLPIEKLGQVRYYDSFLFWPADTTSVTKTFCFEFNADAQAKGEKAFAEFAFVDVDGTPVSTQELRIERNGQVLPQNRFKVTASNPEAELTFTYLPAAKAGSHQGRLQLVNSSNLDRVCSLELSENTNPSLFKWDIKFEKDWNPLVTMLFWLGVIIGSCLGVWFGILRWTLFSRFKIYTLTINEPYFNSIPVNGALAVIFTNKFKKQGILSQFFKGKIIYELNEFWDHECIFMPEHESAVFSSAGYMITPGDLPLEIGTEYRLTDENNAKNKAIISIG